MAFVKEKAPPDGQGAGAEHVHTNHCACPDKPSFLPPPREPTAPANNTHKLRLGDDLDLLAAIKRHCVTEGRDFKPEDYSYLVDQVHLGDHSDADIGIGIGDIVIRGTYTRSKESVYSAAEELGDKVMLHHALLRDCLKYMMDRGPKKGKEKDFEKLAGRIVKATKGKGS